MIDVGLKEKPEDTRLLAYTITKTQLHANIVY